jgi:hypothetical protein
MVDYIWRETRSKLVQFIETTSASFHDSAATATATAAGGGNGSNTWDSAND